MSRQTESRLMLIIGIMCAATPTACLLLGLIGHFCGVNQPGWWLSVSAAYYNNTAPLMIILLSLTAMFMLSYDCYNNKDRGLMIAQGVLCLMIIIFPTKPEISMDHVGILCVPPMLSFVLHTLCSVALFYLFGHMCIFRFRRTTSKLQNQRIKKRVANLCYTIFGSLIWFSTFMLFILGAIDVFVWKGFAYVMLCEYVMLGSYAAAWIIKAINHEF